MVVPERYDIITIGTELPGLITSALLAKRGKKVLILTDSSQLKEEYLFKRGEYTFVREPSLFLGFEKDGVYDQIFSELGITLFLLKRDGYNIYHPSPFLQIVLPDKRIDIFSSYEDYWYELKREFPDEINRIYSFFKEIDEIDNIIYPFVYLPQRKISSNLKERIGYLKDRLRYIFCLLKNSRVCGKEYLSRHDLDGRFKELIDLLTLFFYLSPIDKTSLIQMVSLLGILRRGVVSVPDGIPTLSEILIKNIQKNRGYILSNADRLRFSHKNRRLQGVYINDNMVIEGNRFIFNMLKEPFDNSSKRVYRSYFVTDDYLIPSPMKENLILSTAYTKKEFEDGFIYINLTPKDNIYFAPSGKRCIKISYILSEDRLNRERDVKDRIIDILMKSLTWLMPFSEDRIEVIGDEFEQYQGGRGYSSGIIKDSPDILHKRNVSILYTNRFKMIETPDEAIMAIELADTIAKKRRMGVIMK